MSRLSLTQQLAAYFRAHPATWIDGTALARVAGRYAWRSRVSNCRREEGMTIENRTRKVLGANGTRITVSEYRYVPAAVGVGQ